MIGIIQGIAEGLGYLLIYLGVGALLGIVALMAVWILALLVCSVLILIGGDGNPEEYY